MSNIIDAQDAVIAEVQALIDAKTIDKNFIVQDNSIDRGTLPIVIVDIVTSDPENMSGGGTGFVGFKLELSVVAARSDNDDNYRTVQLFVINAITTIINKIQINAGTLYHKNILWLESKCALAHCEIEHFG